MTMLEFYRSQDTEKEEMALNNRTFLSTHNRENRMLDTYYMESLFIQFYYKNEGKEKVRQ